MHDIILATSFDGNYQGIEDMLGFQRIENKLVVAYAPVFELDEMGRRVRIDGPRDWRPIEPVSQTIKLKCDLSGYYARCECGDTSRPRVYKNLNLRSKDMLMGWALEHKCIPVRALSSQVFWSTS